MAFLRWFAQEFALNVNINQFIGIFFPPPLLNPAKHLSPIKYMAKHPE